MSTVLLLSLLFAGTACRSCPGSSSTTGGPSTRLTRCDPRGPLESTPSDLVLHTKTAQLASDLVLHTDTMPQ
jgi:hypothetical protein